MNGPGVAKIFVAKKVAVKSRLEEKLARDLSAARVPTPVQQFAFASPVGRKYLADFAWPNAKLLVEVNGGLHRGSRGGHTSSSGRYRDQRKINVATLLGFRLLEFSSIDISDGTALIEIETALGICSIERWKAYEIAMASRRRVIEHGRRAKT